MLGLLFLFFFLIFGLSEGKIIERKKGETETGGGRKRGPRRVEYLGKGGGRHFCRRWIKMFDG
ncbi:hypothetical protein V6Z12_A10G145000 [Gossypium hirsutum]